jgi:type VI secretion system protein ImpG
MSFARLFGDELAFLQEVGKDFAAANPTLAPLLADEGGDPDVRRLLEGFAFLTAKLRERMDEDLPELLQDMVAVLAPQLLAPVPPLTTVEWLPRPRALSRAETLPRGTKLRSRPVHGTSCRFMTCYDVQLAPLRLAALTLDEGPRGATLRLRFETTEPLPLGSLGLDRLRLHLSGHLALLRRELLLKLGRHLGLHVGHLLHLEHVALDLLREGVRLGVGHN